jgi:fructokinase
MLTVLGEALIDLVAEESGLYAARPGGSPLNVAVGLARLGLPTELLARLADDAFGRRLRAHAEDNHASTSSCIHARQPTTLAVVSLDEQGRAEYDFYIEGTADWQWTDEELAKLPAGTTVLHTGSLASWTPPGADRVTAMLTRERAGGTLLLSYDPNVRPRLLGSPGRGRTLIERDVALAHVVKSSDEDLAYLYPELSPDEVIDNWLELGPSLVVVTHGPNGSRAGTIDGVRVVRPPIRVEMADTIGAGDAFMAGLLASLYENDLATPEAVRAITADEVARTLDDATLIAALTCERHGADPPTAAERTAALVRRAPSPT